MQQRPGQRTPIINDDVRRLAAFFAADPPFFFDGVRNIKEARGRIEQYLPGDIRQWYNRQDETTKERFIRGVLLETQRQSDAKHTGLFTHLWDAFVRPETLHPEYDRTQPVIGAKLTESKPHGDVRKLKPGEPGRGGVREVGAFEAFANITTTPLRAFTAFLLSYLYKGRTFGRESGTPTKAGSFAENYAADPSWGSVVEAAVPQMHPFARMVLGGVLNMIVDPFNWLFSPIGTASRVVRVPEKIVEVSKSIKETAGKVKDIPAVGQTAKRAAESKLGQAVIKTGKAVGQTAKRAAESKPGQVVIKTGETVGQIAKRAAESKPGQAVKTTARGVATVYRKADEKVQQTADAVLATAKKAVKELKETPTGKKISDVATNLKYLTNRVLEYDFAVPKRALEVKKPTEQEILQAFKDIDNDPQKYSSQELSPLAIRAVIDDINLDEEDYLLHLDDPDFSGYLLDEIKKRREEVVRKSSHPVGEKLREYERAVEELPAWERAHLLFDELVSPDPKYDNLRRWFVNELYRRVVRSTNTKRILTDEGEDLSEDLYKFGREFLDRLEKEDPAQFYDTADRLRRHSLTFFDPVSKTIRTVDRSSEEYINQAIDGLKSYTDEFFKKRTDMILGREPRYAPAVKFWKATKTSLNFPAGMVRNFFQNFIYRYITGDIDPSDLGKTIGRLVKLRPKKDDARDYLKRLRTGKGFFKVFFKETLNYLKKLLPRLGITLETFDHLKKQEKATDVDIAESVKRLRQAESEEKLKLWDRLGSIYGSADLLAAAIMALGKAKLEDKNDLFRIAESLVADYSRTPMLIQRLAQWGVIPFGNWVWYAVTGTARGIKNDPSRLGKILDAVYGSGFEMDVGKRDPDNPVLSDRVRIPLTDRETRADVIIPFEVGAGTDLPLWTLEQIPPVSLTNAYNRATEGETNPLTQLKNLAIQTFMPPTGIHLQRLIIPDTPTVGKRLPPTRTDALISLFGLPLRPRDPFADFEQDIREWRRQIRKQMEEQAQ
ncbi:MAG: hypothetical protein KatS3mg087_2109 [Patescibacteria group bacterium]|nr:MAG: hypothetical protein KatS3mg087_2109 [Patescibacteria group bacterium]